MTDETKSSDSRFKITSLEVFIIVGLIALIVGILLNLNIEINDNSRIRLQNMSNRDLWSVVYSSDYSDEIRINAYELLVEKLNREDICKKSYEALLDSKINSNEVSLRLKKIVLDNPSVSLADKVTSDFLNNKLKDDFWSQLKKSWYKVLLPQAFAKTQLIFKGLEKYDERNLFFVIDVLCQDNNAYIFEVTEKYFNQNQKSKCHSTNMKVIDGLGSLELYFADDVLQVLINIMLSNENSDDFTAFSGKIKETVKKFAHTKEIRQRLYRDLKDLNATLWMSTKDELVSWLESQDN